MLTFQHRSPGLQAKTTPTQLSLKVLPGESTANTLSHALTISLAVEKRNAWWNLPSIDFALLNRLRVLRFCGTLHKDQPMSCVEKNRHSRRHCQMHSVPWWDERYGLLSWKISSECISLYTSENCFGSKNPRFSVEVLPVISKSSSHSFISKVILQCQSSRLPLGVVTKICKNWLSCHLNWTIWPEISYFAVFSYSKVGRVSFLCSLLRVKGKITVKDTFFRVCVAAAVKSWPSEEFATTKKDPQVSSGTLQE